MKTKRRFKKGSDVWFVDSEFRNKVETAFPEWGKYVKSTRKGFCLIDTFFGNVEFNKECLFATKEECENFIQEEIKKMVLGYNHKDSHYFGVKEDDTNA